MTSLKKEIRTLAWPAAAIIAVIVLPTVWAPTFEPTNVPRHLLYVWQSAFQLSSAGFLLGSALLAALPVGAEFQHRTMVLLMAQPVSRRSIWLTKQAVLMGVLAVVGLAAYFVTAPQAPRDAYTVAHAVFLLILLCSGGLWTLVAGSTIGGAVFSLAGLALVELTSSFFTSQVTGLELDPFDAHPALVATRVAYGALTLWLGWRMFARYELSSHGAGGIALATGLAERLPALRSQPTGAIANLIRKEIRLQQPTFLIAALFTAVWLVAMLFFAMSPARPDVANVVFTVLLVSYYPLAILVCGTISIGEDTSLGIRAWHLTLPVSSFKQWAVKLGVTLGVGAVLAVALPLVLTAILPSFVPLPPGALRMPGPGGIAIAAGTVLVLSFWSASLLGHTIRAAVAVGILVPALWVCVVLSNLVASRWGVGTDVLTGLMVANQWSPDDLLPMTSKPFGRAVDLGVRAAGVAVLLLVLWQSLTAFRAAQADRRTIGRYVFVLAIVALIASFIPPALIVAGENQVRSQPVRELQSALHQISTASLAAGGRIPEAVEITDLEATGVLSDATRRWLASSRVTLKPTATFYRSGADGRRYVVASLHLPNGRQFTSYFSLPARPAR